MIEIREPRWKDRSVLVATYKVKYGKNLLRFTRTPSMPGVYSFDGERVRMNCDINSNGKIDCYVVPLSWIVPEEKQSARVTDNTEEVGQMVMEELRY